MGMLALLVTSGAGYRLIANEAFPFVHLPFCPPPPDTATEAEAPRTVLGVNNDGGSRGDGVGHHDLRVIAVQPSPDTG